MPRASKPAKPLPASQTLVLDNGANTIKAGLISSSSSDSTEPSLIPNTLAKLPNSKHVYVGSQLNSCRDFAEMVFRRPVQHGQLVNWESEREIWSQSFFDGSASSALNVDPSQTNLLLTEAPNALPNLSSNTDQVVFEEFEFAAYRRVIAPVLNAYGDVRRIMGHEAKLKAEATSENDGEAMNIDSESATAGGGSLAAECVLVVDSGYSQTTVTPVYKGRPIQQAIRRLDVGGKLMTNYLKEMLSLRQLDLTHEFHIVNELKEDVCYISRDFKSDLERTWKQGPRYDGKKKASHALPSDEDDTSMADDSEAAVATPSEESIVIDYALPDYTTTFRGRIQPHNPSLSKPSAKLQQQLAAGSASDTIVTLGNERFAVPELLFSPSDVGLPQAGLAEIIMQSVRAIPPGLWNAMLGNVLVVGGNAKIPHFAERLFEDLRPLVPEECTVKVRKADDPVTSTWYGGAKLVEKATEAGKLGEVFVTRAEYQEHGEQWLRRQFAGEKHLPA